MLGCKSTNLENIKIQFPEKEKTVTSEGTIQYIATTDTANKDPTFSLCS